MNNTTNIQRTTTKRIEYVDALRGVTMLMVVLNHSASYFWGILQQDVPSFHRYFLLVRMPMFFFISGFLLYKKEVVWTMKHTLTFLKKKFLVQIIPTILFLLVFTYVFEHSFLETIKDPFKQGYWFTYTLFFYFLFYATTQLIGCSSKLLILMGLIFYPFLYINKLDIQNGFIKDIIGFVGVKQWTYFIFFVLGTITKKHFERFQIIIDGKWLMTICIILFVILNAYIDLFPEIIQKTIIKLILSTTGVIILFAFFRRNQSIFAKSTQIGTILQYIGKRTLDIYLIHYFLLPYNIIGHFTFFVDHPMPIVELACSSILAVIITAICLLISNFIRLSPFLAHYLFGVKNR